jgi:glucokinase
MFRFLSERSDSLAGDESKPDPCRAAWVARFLPRVVTAEGQEDEHEKSDQFVRASARITHRGVRGLRLFRGNLPSTQAVLAVAAPATGNAVTFTNRRWTFSPEELRRQLAQTRASFISLDYSAPPSLD